MEVKSERFFHQATNTFTYVVSDPASKECVIIDPVADFDLNSGRLGFASVDKVIEYINVNALRPVCVLETHIHADHVTAASYLKKKFACPIAVSHRVEQVGAGICGLFGIPDWSPKRYFDRFLADGDLVVFGAARVEVLETPGHTPACLSFRIGQRVYVGDLIFATDLGSGRCDFPGGDSARLYDSVRKLYTLPDDTLCMLGHDYPGAEREDLVSEVSLVDQKMRNKHLGNEISRDEFVALRAARDAGLSLPRQILGALQLNIRAGALPDPDSAGKVFLNIPINHF